MPTTDAVAGLLLAELAYLLLFLLPVGFAVGLALAVATALPLFAVSVPAAVATAAVAVLAVGFPLGLALRHVLTRIPFVARHKAWLVVAVFLLYVVVLTGGAFEALVSTLFEPMRHAPPGWIADLLLAPLPSAGSRPALAAGGILLAGLLALGSVVATAVVARAHWFSDPALAGVREPVQGVGARRGRRELSARLATGMGRPTAAVVVLAWRRAARAPLKLIYVAYPVLFLAGALADVVQTGVVPAYLAYGTLVFVTWAAAVMFTLNPIGDQGAVLPVTLLSRLSGRAFVRGQMLAGLVVGLPAGTVLTGLVGVASPLALDRVLLLTALAPVVMVLASMLAVGVGTAFPRFESVEITRSMSALVPSLTGFLLFAVYLLLTAAAAVLTLDPAVRPVVAALVSWLLPGTLAVSPGTVGVLATLSLAGLVVVPLWSYRYAIRRFDAYTIE